MELGQERKCIKIGGIAGEYRISKGQMEDLVQEYEFNRIIDKE